MTTTEVCPRRPVGWTEPCKNQEAADDYYYDDQDSVDYVVHFLSMTMTIPGSLTTTTTGCCTLDAVPPSPAKTVPPSCKGRSSPKLLSSMDTRDEDQDDSSLFFIS
mmetsp:Transcript_4121/g.8319  ORF Transcript_4121/g.8319 Transcript_4121/m.8319 type:complete len:106 (+) Transcript_4121:132-449(+)